ncbi:hypothetical protein AT15_09775 [Kosmotoga arenicorallina S304]|uniref:ABC-2 type transport system permease protein n=1 Tax=Kosmotoga arenicorallina S304 TaxID=1453497 RepID=A0A176K0Z5_9BACT|nr:hypothetical protein [Kosmotoga arenicorallina]OAA30707.1 hypothetical protein AT15_09775 [Kosmotoga arenicorallina S304]
MRLKRLISLIWTIINANYGLSNIKIALKKDKKNILLLALMIYAFVAIGFSFVFFYRPLLISSFQQLAAIGMENLFLANAFLSAGILGFITGFFLLVSTLFFSRDMRVLITLPIRASDVVTAKLTVVILFQMIVSLAVLLPSLIYYGIQKDAGFPYWFYMAFLFLLSQIFPILFQTIIILPLSRIVKFSRMKDFMLYILGIGALGGSLIVVFFVNRSAVNGGNGSPNFVNIFANPDAFINKLALIYPPAFFATKALLSKAFSGFAWFLGYLGLHILAFAFTVWFAKNYYYDTYNELQQFYAGRKKLSSEELNRELNAEKGPFSALHSREWKYLLRVPSFALNGLSGTFILPIMVMIFPFIFKGNQEAMGDLGNFFLVIKSLYVPLGILCGALAGSMNGLAASAFSREGKLLKELKALPVSSADVFKAKFVNLMEISLMGIILMTIALHILLGGSLLFDILIILLSVLVTAFLNLIQLIIDAMRPLLNWDNPQRAIKQNFNVAIAILIVFSFVGGFGYLSFKLVDAVSSFFITSIITLCGVVGLVFLIKPALKLTGDLMRRDL